MDNGSVGVKLLRCVTAVICEFFDEILVPLAKLILRAVCDGERPGAEMLQQVLQQAVWQAIFIGPGPVTENSLQLVGVDVLHLPKRLHNCYTDILRNGTDVIPVTALGNDKRMELMLVKLGGVLAVFLPCGRGLLVVHVANSLEKQQRKYILLISSRVNICAEENGGVPQIGLQFLNGDPFTH